MSRQALSFEIVTTATLAEALPLLAAQFEEHHIEVEPRALEAAAAALADSSNRGALILAREAGSPAAIAAMTFTWSLEHAGRIAWLEELYVRGDRRSRGIGKKLLEHACSVAGRAGCRAIELEVTEDHLRAERLYERSSFRFLARRRWVRRLPA
jgi:GNAT superfamily N-acetyltransferase